MRLGVVGPELDGPLIAGHRLLQPPLVRQRDPQVVVGLGEVGLEADGPLIAGRRLLRAVRFQDAPQVVVGVGEVGLERMAR